MSGEKWPNVHHQANHSKSLEHHKQNFMRPKCLEDLYIEVAKWDTLAFACVMTLCLGLRKGAKYFG